MAGHVVIAIHIVHSLETNRAEPIPRQILVLFEHILFTLKEKGTTYIVLLQLGLYFASLPHGAMLSWPAVCNCGITWPFSVIFGTIIIVDENTIVLHKIEL